jgi:hypothetical protein
MGGTYNMNGEKRNMYILLAGKRSLGGPSHRWVYNIKMDLGEIQWGGI